MAKATNVKATNAKAASKKRVVKVDSLRRCSHRSKFQQHYYQFNQQAGPGYFLVICW